ncbi:MULTISPECIES: hypothetical protein [Enterococcus]|uniref:hypothetical protein n=1 Tax=Enterococcus TaxID=1350 RepID=UPI001A9205A1|nr:hypothetical protein [Enterococcus ureilyticus]MBO0447771.1 hypothetical protein [Enterococcus ureilyticus]
MPNSYGNKVPTNADAASKVYIPTYSTTQPTPSYAGGYAPKVAETRESYAAGARILIDKNKVETEICVNIMLGLTQIKEGITSIKNQKETLTDEDWASDSDDSYREYVENFLAYMKEVESFFETLSKKIINDADTFSQLDAYISKIVNSDSDISSWR